MKTRLGRTLPPAAAPIPFLDMVRALPSCFGDSMKSLRFEDDLRREFEQKYCFLVSSGKAALVLILKALHEMYPERDEVVIPAFTCYSVPAAIKRAGLKVRLCDAGEASLEMDASQLRDIMAADSARRKLLCVLVTHLYGCTANYAVVEEIVGNRIPIVEDAAQAMGEKYGRQKIGTLADVGFFSLDRGKALSTMGGGVILTNRSDIGELLNGLCGALDVPSVTDNLVLAVKAVLAKVLQYPRVFWLPKSLPSLRLGETLYEESFAIQHLSGFQKKLGEGWRRRLVRHRRHRETNCTFWLKKLPRGLTGVCPGRIANGMVRFPVFLPSANHRAIILTESEERGFGIMPSYPTPINRIPQLESDFEGQEFPNAQALADRLITLPVHELVDDDDNHRIEEWIRPLIASSDTQSR